MSNIPVLALVATLVSFVGKTTTRPYTIQRVNPDYKYILKLSLLFYEAQRSGKLPPNNRITWRGDSALNDRGNFGEDLTGGYYDAGDYVKLSITTAFTTTMLSWGLITFGDAYRKAGEYQHCLDAIKWGTDYLIKCHTQPYELYAQVGDFQVSNEFWGRPEDMDLVRRAYKIDKDNPGSDLAGEASAALAAASVVFRDINETYSQELLQHSKELYSFAVICRGLYHTSIPGTLPYYESTGYGDELTWAALWLFKVTQETKYLEEAESFYSKFRIKDRPNEFFFNKKAAGIQVLFSELSRKDEYIQLSRSFCDFSMNEQMRTPKGLIYIDKVGTLSHAANVAFICLQAAALNISTPQYVQFAKEQVHYMLGELPVQRRSFVVGYGQNYPKRPHHAGSSCPDKPNICGLEQFLTKEANPQILYGALVSGPDQNDKYEDVRQEVLYNEVTLDYNAGFQGSVAGLIHFQDRT